MKKENNESKPRVKLTGRVMTTAKSYGEALELIQEYVEVY